MEIRFRLIFKYYQPLNSLVMKKLKILICIFLNFYILGLHSIAQNSISGTLDLAQTATTERNFVGFNSGQGYLEMIYNKGNANANLV